MNTPYNAIPENGKKIVYVRAVAVADLPREVREQVDGLKTLYAVHSDTGERLALVADKRMAFALAREHDMAPVSVH
jgi:hypothetical protein